MSEKKIAGFWWTYGRKRGFGIGFDISDYHWNIDLGFWYFGQEF